MADTGLAKERILVVDDDARIQRILMRILGKQGYQCTAADDAASAREALETAPYDLILCDVRLPDGSGLDVVADASRQQERLAALVVSGLDDVTLAEHALQVGAYGYIVKPFTPNDVIIGVLGALRQRRTEHLAGERQSGDSSDETIHRLCIAVEARDPETAAHITRMSDYCWRIARELHLERERCDTIRAASPMHDVGKVGVPDAVLLKPGQLTTAERAEMQRHAEIGYRILAGSRNAVLEMAATIAWTHHERFDGSGYPRGLDGERIPLEGRIAAVADVWDALTRDRIYRARMPRGEALGIMRDGRGSDFDPAVLDALMRATAEAELVDGSRLA